LLFTSSTSLPYHFSLLRWRQQVSPKLRYRPANTDGAKTQDICNNNMEFVKLLSELNWLNVIVSRQIVFMNTFLPMALEPKSDRVLLCIEVSVITHTSHTVVLLWTSDQPVADAQDNTTYKHETNIHALSGIRTHDPRNQAAADLRLRPRGYWDRRL
jgi:hypothetical protein